MQDHGGFMLSKMQLVTMLIKFVSHVIAKCVTSKNVSVDAVSPTVHANYLQFVLETGTLD